MPVTLKPSVARSNVGRLRRESAPSSETHTSFAALAEAVSGARRTL
jgi:hypothetical protein